MNRIGSKFYRQKKKRHINPDRNYTVRAFKICGIGWLMPTVIFIVNPVLLQILHQEQ